MMKKSFSVLLITVFLLLSLLPSLGMPIFGASPLLANESAVRTPALTGKDGKLNLDVLAELTDYMGSRFALRPYMVSARSFLYEKLLRSSAEDQVVLGSDGQFYYSSTLDDYCGHALSGEDLARIADRLLAIQSETEARGAQFLFTVAPNKNSLIPESMPSRYPAGHEQSNWSRLLPMLEERGVHAVDLHSVLAGNAALYYRTDSHWTAEGAAIAADALLGALGRESGFSSGPFSENGLHVGDLYQMLYPVGKGREAELIYAPGHVHRTDSDPRGGNAITIRTNSPDGTGTLYCRRDSFGIALYPYLADAFEQAEFSRSSDWSEEAFSDLDADVVILEIVERSIPALLPESEAAGS